MTAHPAFEAGHYHLSVHTISKLKGNSVLAMAAYRHAERFRTSASSVIHAAAYQRAQQLGNDGRVFDYRRKIGVAWTGIVAPGHTPKELLDAEALWNTVERIESRKNARLAREMIIGLPHQVDLEIHVAMLRAFITSHLSARGMIADVAIHRPPVEHGGDPRNWHAHVLLTDRPITPDGFAAHKDRSWNAKENLMLWRKAWADIHNATMEHLGLPQRISHLSLDAQRQDALTRGDVVSALDLNREPQIHVGKALHARHPRHTIYAERRRHNEGILTRNKIGAANRADRMRSHVANAEDAAYQEARQHAHLRDMWAKWEPEPMSLDELKARYGRPQATSRFGRLKDKAFQGDVLRRALALSRDHDHPWHHLHPRADAPSVFDVLRPMIPKTGPGHPVFTVTAKDIAFAFYGFGFLSLRELQRSLQNIAQDEERLRNARKGKKYVPPPPQRRPLPKIPTPKAEHLAHLRSFAPVPEGIYLKRLEQLNAFKARHQSSARKSTQARANRPIMAPTRRMHLQNFNEGSAN